MPPENLSQLRDEGRSRHHLGDARRARRADEIRLHMRDESDGRDRGQCGIGLHFRDEAERIDARVVEIEDHERRRRRGERAPGGIGRSGEADGGAKLTGRRLDLGREHQIVENR